MYLKHSTRKCIHINNFNTSNRYYTLLTNNKSIYTLNNSTLNKINQVKTFLKYNTIRTKITNSTLPRETSRPINLPDDVYQLSNLIKELINSKRIEDAIATLLNNSNRYHQPIVAWNILLKSIVEEDKLKLGLKLFNELKRRGIKANDHTYCILLDGCAKSKAPKAQLKAQKLMEEMQSKAILNSENSYSKRNETKENKSNQFIKREIPLPGKNKIISIIEELPVNKGPSLYHYNNMLKVYSRNNLIKMIELYDNMRLNLKNKTQLDKVDNNVNCAPDIVSYTIVANALARIKSDDAFIETINIWLDYRSDVEANSTNKMVNKNKNNKSPPKTIQDRKINFDIGFLQAIVLASRFSNNPEFLYKGIQLIDHAFDMKLKIEYPNTQSFHKLPDLNDNELASISNIQPNLAIIDLVLTIASVLKLYNVIPKILQCFYNKYSIKLDYNAFATVLSAHCHRMTQLFDDNNRI